MLETSKLFTYSGIDETSSRRWTRLGDCPTEEFVVAAVVCKNMHANGNPSANELLFWSRNIR
jgi:hypothetical protein